MKSIAAAEETDQMLSYDLTGYHVTKLYCPINHNIVAALCIDANDPNRYPVRACCV